MAEAQRHADGTEHSPFVSPNQEVIEAAKVMLGHALGVLSRGESEERVAIILAGVAEALQTLPQPFRILPSLLNDPDPVARRARARSRFEEILQQFQQVTSEDGVIQFPQEATSLKEPSLAEIQAAYEAKLLPLKQRWNTLRLYQLYKPEAYDPFEFIELSEKIALREQERDHAVEHRKVQLEKKFDQALKSEAVERRDERSHEEREQELEAWVRTLSRETRLQLQDALEEQQKPSVKPYRLRGQIHLLLRQANTTMTMLSKHKDQWSEEEKAMICEKGVSLLAARSKEAFLRRAIEVVEDCRQRYPYQGATKKKEVISQIHILADSMPTREQLPESGISKSDVGKARSSIMSLLISMGMKKGEVIKARDQRKAAEKSGVPYEDAEILKLMQVVKNTTPNHGRSQAGRDRYRRVLGVQKKQELRATMRKQEREQE